MRKNRNKIESAISSRRKTDSAGWRDATLKSLTDSQKRIKRLCEAFLAGEITSKEFRWELPQVLNARDRERLEMNS